MNRRGYQAVCSSLFEAAESLYGASAADHYDDVTVVPLNVGTEGLSRVDTDTTEDFDVRYVRFLLNDRSYPEFVIEAMLKRGLMSRPDSEPIPGLPSFLCLGSWSGLVSMVDLSTPK